MYDKNIYNLWNELQQDAYDYSKDTPIGTFSVDTCKTAVKFGSIVEKELKGKCLDIGCGLLPLPAYMKNHKDIIFVGIDPYQDNIKRKFDFSASIGEALPFKNESFNGVLMASTIDHMIDPKQAIKESYRVLKKNSKLLIWFGERPRVHLGKTRYNRFHQWAFSSECLGKLVANQKFNKVHISKTNKKQRVLIGIKQ